jgi:hypothetical protein
MKTVNGTPMIDLIAKHLINTGSITNVEAQAIYRCRALPRRIADLKELGFPIKSEMKKDEMDQRYVRYSLDKGAL